MEAAVFEGYVYGWLCLLVVPIMIAGTLLIWWLDRDMQKGAAARPPRRGFEVKPSERSSEGTELERDNDHG
jgi:hypothetical protein